MRTQDIPEVYGLDSAQRAITALANNYGVQRAYRSICLAAQNHRERKCGATVASHRLWLAAMDSFSEEMDAIAAQALTIRLQIIEESWDTAEPEPEPDIYCPACNGSGDVENHKGPRAYYDEPQIFPCRECGGSGEKQK